MSDERKAVDATLELRHQLVDAVGSADKVLASPEALVAHGAADAELQTWAEVEVNGKTMRVVRKVAEELNTEQEVCALVAAMRPRERAALHMQTREAIQLYGKAGVCEFSWQGEVFQAEATLLRHVLEAVEDVMATRAFAAGKATAIRHFVDHKHAVAAPRRHPNKINHNPGDLSRKHSGWSLGKRV